MGAVRLPDHVLYGAQTQRAINNFPISGNRAHPELVRAYLRLKAAAAVANEQCGAIDPARAALIQQAAHVLLAMDDREREAHFPVDAFQAGAGTSQNMNANEVLAHVADRINPALGIHPNDHVNRSQSTNDTYPTAMRMAIVEASEALKTELRRCGTVLRTKAEQWWTIPKAARTHLQDAVPMRLGQEAHAWSTTFFRLESWIEDGRNACRELGLGGSAAGTGLNVPENFARIAIDEISRQTGEKFRLSDDLFEAMQSQSPVSFYSSMLRLMALELTRICNDLRLLASGPMNGLNELRLPEVQPGSSIMPGKVNPSMVEMANQTWFAVLGYDQTVAYAAQAGQLELNVMMPIMARSILEATRIATNALAALRVRCLDGLEPNEPRLRHFYENTPQTATALSPRLGYENTATLVKEAMKSGKTIVELVRAKKLIPEPELKDLLQDLLNDPKHARRA